MPWTHHRSDGEVTVFDHHGDRVDSMRVGSLHVYGGAEGFVRFKMQDRALDALDEGNSAEALRILIMAEFGLIEEVDEPPDPPDTKDDDSGHADGTGAGLGPDRHVPEEGTGPSDVADEHDDPDDDGGWSFSA
jgi:hypothetical protein